jgi:hypothetical protein
LFTHTDRALLLSEFVDDKGLEMAFCPVCETDQETPHTVGCSMDLALAERGFGTAGERERARALIRLASSDTIPPSSAP